MHPSVSGYTHIYTERMWGDRKQLPVQDLNRNMLQIKSKSTQLWEPVPISAIRPGDFIAPNTANEFHALKESVIIRIGWTPSGSTQLWHIQYHCTATTLRSGMVSVQHAGGGGGFWSGRCSVMWPRLIGPKQHFHSSILTRPFRWWE